MNTREFDSLFGCNLMVQRKIKRISQAKLARAVGVSRQTISNWEGGYTHPDIIYLVKLAEVLEIKIDSLVQKPKKEVDDNAT